MTPFEIVYGITAGLALIIGAVIEWRRGSDFGHRLTAIEQQELGRRLGDIEATMDRIKRGLT